MNGQHVDPEKIWKLAALVADGGWTEADRAELENLLRTSGEARRLYAEYILLHGELYWHAGLSSRSKPLFSPVAQDFQDFRPEKFDAARAIPIGVPDGTESPFEFVSAEVPRPGVRIRQPRRILALTAGVILTLGICLLAINLWRFPVSQSQSPIALVEIFETASVRPSEIPDRSTEGSHINLMEGSYFNLEDGVAQITLASGALAILEGPGGLHVLGKDGYRLDKGILSLVSGERGRKPVRIVTPFGEVREVGTRFAIRAGSEGGEIHVFEGQVEIRLRAGFQREALAGGNAESSWPPARYRLPIVREVSKFFQGGRQVLVLHAGEALHVMSRQDGGSFRMIRAQPAKFVHPLAGRGGVARWRHAVLSEPTVRHLWSFEGWTPGEKLRDRKGKLHLQEVVMFEGAGGESVGYVEQGADLSSRAVRFHRAGQRGNWQGVALQTYDTFHPPEAFSVELVVRFDRPDRVTAEDLCVLLGTRQGPDRCGFLAAADGWGQVGIILDANHPWLETPVRLTPGQWYFLALTFRREWRDHGVGTVVDWYMAPIGGPAQPLTQIVSGGWIAGWIPPGQLGIGKGFEKNGAHAYPWPGAVDEIAIFDAPLDEETITRHFQVLQRN